MPKISSTLAAGAWRCVFALSAVMVFCCAAPVKAQSITVRVLNARTGRPLARQNVTISWPDRAEKTVVSLGADGTAKLDVGGETGFGMLPGADSGKEPNKIAYIDCNHFSMVPVADVVNRGLVSANLCSAKVSANVKPGEVVFWGVPRHWWETASVSDR